ncbi:MAG TPA: DUF4197 domain-containing protein [Candidatus Saccharimonadales bacterium]|jgi:hypothetical protein|nr:DUF4197 domain-containing protein [Candidatus Saccharimonadales bacterium]
MKHRSVILLALAMMISLFARAQPQDQDQSPWGGLLKKAESALNKQKSGSLTSDKISAGLKEALKISTGKAVAQTGRPDGFLKNEAIKILLPPKLQTVSRGLRLAGVGAQVDDLEVGMNRAAERAAPAAKQIFLNALLKMTFSDARQILSGGNTAATDFFKKTSTTELTTAFTPTVHQAMDSVGVVRQYNQIMKNPMAASLAGRQNLNLDSYVVGKTLDGLFYVLGQEEEKIRKDPAAQTTALLKEVFGRKQ